MGGICNEKFVPTVTISLKEYMGMKKRTDEG